MTITAIFISITEKQCTFLVVNECHKTFSLLQVVRLEKRKTGGFQPVHYMQRSQGQGTNKKKKKQIHEILYIN